MSESQILQQRAAQRVGTAIAEKWLIEALLGIGGMATVYAARHRNGKRVAIKILHAELCLSHEALTRFVREGYLANLVEHPGAVSVLDDGTLPDGTPFLVMEYLEGETVDARCERLAGKLDLLNTLSIFDAVLDVLRVAHEKGVVHRDIKPENIFLTSDGGVKILDFGIARVADMGLGPSATVSGSALGTPTFMAPEQARGDRDLIDARTDIWAVGAAMFNTLTGQFVHNGKNLNELLVAAMMKPARSLGSVSRNTPESIVALVDRSLRYDPNDRFQNAREMQHALRETARALGLVVPAKPDLLGFVAPPPPPRMSFGSVSEVSSLAVPLPRPSAHSRGVVDDHVGDTVPAPPMHPSLPDPAPPATVVSPRGELPREGIEVTPPTSQAPARNTKPVWIGALALVGVIGVAGVAINMSASSATSGTTSATPSYPPAVSASVTATSSASPAVSVAASSAPSSTGATARPLASAAARPMTTIPARPISGGVKDIGDSRN